MSEKKPFVNFLVTEKRHKTEDVYAIFFFFFLILKKKKQAYIERENDKQFKLELMSLSLSGLSLTNPTFFTITDFK